MTFRTTTTKLLGLFATSTANYKGFNSYILYPVPAIKEHGNRGSLLIPFSCIGLIPSTSLPIYATLPILPL